MKLSLVVPCFNEAENVALFQETVIDAFRDCGYTYEIIYVDDGTPRIAYQSHPADI